MCPKKASIRCCTLKTLLTLHTRGTSPAQASRPCDEKLSPAIQDESVCEQKLSRHLVGLTARVPVRLQSASSAFTSSRSTVPDYEFPYDFDS